MLCKFTDGMKREWSVGLTYGLAGRVREQTGQELLILIENGKISDLTAMHLPWDQKKFLEVLWAIVADQAKHYGADKQSFADAFDAPTKDAAQLAYRSAVALFSPEPEVLMEVVRTLEKANRPNDEPTLNSSGGNSPEVLGATLPT